MQCPTCKCSELWAYGPETNEAGWKCLGCGHRPGEPEGFCPALDVDWLYVKVECLLHALHDAKLIYISNSDHGESLISSVTSMCEGAERYDQYTIIEFLYRRSDSHGDYWKRIVEGVLTEKDGRQRCECGRLATAWTGGKHYCRDHVPSEF